MNGFWQNGDWCFGNALCCSHTLISKFPIESCTSIRECVHLSSQPTTTPMALCETISFFFFFFANATALYCFFFVSPKQWHEKYTHCLLNSNASVWFVAVAFWIRFVSEKWKSLLIFNLWMYRMINGWHEQNTLDKRLKNASCCCVFIRSKTLQAHQLDSVSFVFL